MFTTTTSTHATTIADLYAAFGRGDVPFIMDHLSDAISWDHGLRQPNLHGSNREPASSRSASSSGSSPRAWP